MGSTRPFEGARLVIAILSAADDTEVLDRAKPLLSALEGRFGEADFLVGGIPFAWTNYYAGELGASVARGFVSFPGLVDPSALASIKLWTNGVEERFAREGSRRFNLDPGLLSLGGFVLATTKGRSHRIALSEGIYAELTLMYEGGAYRPLPWTYPDWRSAEYGAVLAEIRSRLRLALRNRK